jgi:hypothetical protein
VVVTEWFDELDLDPASSWLRMGTRALGPRPWLVVDERAEDELALKAELLDQRRGDVLRCEPGADEAARDTLTLVSAVTTTAPGITDPLERAARSVQEDLCLLRRRDGAWHLDAACVCFPSRWRLADKIGRPLIEVHGPTPGYDPHLTERVTRLLDRLTARPVLRRNWFVHPDGSLFQPVAPGADPVVPDSEVADRLHLRSERQTLRRLGCGWVLFTIRVQQDPLGVALSTADRRRRFADYVRSAPAADLRHRGMADAQVDELRRWLTAGR